jgi:hypothetical protein
MHTARLGKMMMISSVDEDDVGVMMMMTMRGPAFRRYFAIVDVMRRVVYAALQYSLRPASTAQLIWMLLLSLAYGSILHHLRPYR